MITPTPTSAGASGTTNVNLGLQLEDSVRQHTTAGPGTTLTLSTSSAKGFFASTMGGTGTLNAPVNLTFANGLGTATEYYGDEAASASTTITAKNGTNSWGSTTVTITAKTTGYTLTIVSGSPQSATVNTAFANPLVVQDLDQYNNPVTGATVTFTAPASGASGTFASTSNRITTATIGTNGQATSSVFTANTTAGGPYNVSASATGGSGTVNFALTNVAGAAQTSSRHLGQPPEATGPRPTRTPSWPP